MSARDPAAPTETIAAQMAHLRERLGQLPGGGSRAIRAFARFREIWEERLTGDWQPPAGSPFPWAQVRRSLAALLPGLAELAMPPVGEPDRYPVVALILAGNTPLLAWPALVAALTAGCAIYVKMSRDETLWCRLFVEALAESDPEVAARVHLAAWPGEDARTTELVQVADAVIAYGSDATIDQLRTLTPTRTPFYGFGHAISIGVWTWQQEAHLSPDFNDWLPRVVDEAEAFEAEVLMYQQQGCLSPVALFVEAKSEYQAAAFGAILPLMEEWFPVGIRNLDVPPVTDLAVARAVREARDMALFEGATVKGDEGLRWTILVYPDTRPLPPPIGFGVLPIIPVRNIAAEIGGLLGPLRGKISCAGIAGPLTPETEAALQAAGIGRICRAGEMQTPPLDWENGGMDLFVELRQLAGWDAAEESHRRGG